MTAKQTRNLILAVAASLVLICALPPPFAGLVGFVGGFTALMMWLKGYLSTPKFVRAARRAMSDQRRTAEPHPDVPVRRFRYPVHLWRMRFGIALLWIMALGHALLAVLLVAAWPGSPEERLATGLVPAAAAWMFGRIAYATPRMRVDVDPAGIVSRQLFGTVRIAWDDIVLLSNIDYLVYGKPYSASFRIYSLQDVITVGDQLLEYAALVAIVENNARYAIATA